MTANSIPLLTAQAVLGFAAVHLRERANGNWRKGDGQRKTPQSADHPWKRRVWIERALPSEL